MASVEYAIVSDRKDSQASSGNHLLRSLTRNAFSPLTKGRRVSRSQASSQIPGLAPNTSKSGASRVVWENKSFVARGSATF